MSQWNTPVVGASIVIFRDKRWREVLLIERGREPAKGRWAFPGGKLEVGETVVEGARRELLEETGLHAYLPADAAFAALDRISRADDGTLAHHYILVVVAGWYEGADEPRAGDDAAACRWWPVADLDAAQPQVEDLARMVRMARQRLEELDTPSPR